MPNMQIEKTAIEIVTSVKNIYTQKALYVYIIREYKIFSINISISKCSPEYFI